MACHCRPNVRARSDPLRHLTTESVAPSCPTAFANCGPTICAAERRLSYFHHNSRWRKTLLSGSHGQHESESGRTPGCIGEQGGGQKPSFRICFPISGKQPDDVRTRSRRNGCCRSAIRYQKERTSNLVVSYRRFTLNLVANVGEHGCRKPVPLRLPKSRSRSWR